MKVVHETYINYVRETVVVAGLSNKHELRARSARCELSEKCAANHCLAQYVSQSLNYNIVIAWVWKLPASL